MVRTSRQASSSSTLGLEEVFKVRILILICLIGALLPLPARGQSEEADQYSISLVQRALKLHQQGARVSFVEKRIPRLGDQVSIALMKIFTDRELSDPKTLELILPLVREAFSQPQFISVDIDRRPSVTLFFLKYLHQTVPDLKAQDDIAQTVRFVTENVR